MPPVHLEAASGDRWAPGYASSVSTRAASSSVGTRTSTSAQARSATTFERVPPSMQPTFTETPRDRSCNAVTDQDLPRQLVDGTRALAGIAARVGGHARHGQLIDADALAAGLDAAVGKRRFEHEDGITPAGFVFDHRAGLEAADLFVGRDQKRDARRGAAAAVLETRAGPGGRPRDRPSCRRRPGRTAGHRGARSASARAARRATRCRSAPGPAVGVRRSRTRPADDRPPARVAAGSPCRRPRRTMSPEGRHSDRAPSCRCWVTRGGPAG